MICTKIENCRSGISGGTFHSVMNFGELYLNAYPYPGEDHTAYPKAPIQLVWNDKTKLLQNLHTVNRSVLYDEYWYRSGINETMVQHLKDVVDFARSFVVLHPNDVVLDIASNDGTLLRQYPQDLDLFTVGYDPAQNLAAEAREGVNCHFSLCFDAEHYISLFRSKCKIITACAVIYHMPNLLQFLDGVESILDDEGVFVCEFSYLPSIMVNSAFDAVGHEHLSHLSLLAFEKIVDKTNFRIVHAELQSINSGTLLVALKLKPCEVKERPTCQLKELRDHEASMGMERLETYINWAKRGQVVKHQLVDYLTSLKSHKKSIAAYGASTKGSILLQWCGINNQIIDFVAERNEHKLGREMVGCRIPIVSELIARQYNPDYFLVLPWAFSEAFIKREREYLEKGGQMIFPLPQLRIVKREVEC